MTFDARKSALIILKCLFVLACVSILLSIYWLRPLMIEGGRYTISFIQNMKPFWDQPNFRFLLVPFQIPALIAMKNYSGILPLTVARIYFFSIYVPVIVCFFYFFLRLKEEKEWFIGALVFFLVFLPNMNFQLSHINETFLVFIFAAISVFRLKPIFFAVLSFLAILGHPAVMVPFLLLLFFLMLEIFYFKRKGFLILSLITMIMILLLLWKTYITVSIFPRMSGIYLSIFLNHFGGIASRQHDYISAGFILIFCISVELFLGPKRISKVIWILSLVLVGFFIYREHLSEIAHFAFQYRVFSLIFFCTFMIYTWLILRLKMKPVSSPYAYAFLVVLASWLTVREVKSSVWFWKDAPKLVRLDLPPGCHYTDESAGFIHASLPVLRIFLANKREVDTVLYSVSYDPEKKLCHAFQNSAFPYQLDSNGKIQSYFIPSEGFFTISPLKEKN